jgi:antitoxin YefM
MKTISYSHLRRNLVDVLDNVVENREPVIIMREPGKPGVVLMPHEDFRSYEETRYLLQSPRNADRLLKAVAELDALQQWCSGRSGAADGDAVEP